MVQSVCGTATFNNNVCIGFYLSGLFHRWNRRMVHTQSYYWLRHVCMKRSMIPLMIHAYVLTTQGTVFNQPDWDNWRCNYNYTTGTSRTCLLWNILILRLDHFEFYPIHSLVCKLLCYRIRTKHTKTKSSCKLKYQICSLYRWCSLGFAYPKILRVISLLYWVLLSVYNGTHLTPGTNWL